MEPILQKFGERLKSLRTERRIKQAALAEFLDCSIRQYQRLEYGEVNIQALTLSALADYFGVTTDYLLGRTDEKN